jgi:hypothetical protein
VVVVAALVLGTVTVVVEALTVVVVDVRPLETHPPTEMTAMPTIKHLTICRTRLRRRGANTPPG